MSSRHRLGDLQLAIMDVLWTRGQGTAAEVHAALLESRGLALTTIATMLRKMEVKGVVRHRRNGRQFVYRPRIARDDVHRSMVGDLVDRLFAGDAKALVSHLLTEGDLDAGELEELRRIVDRANGDKR
jgi:BlaI family penicillinase repressor